MSCPFKAVLNQVDCFTKLIFTFKISKLVSRWLQLSSQLRGEKKICMTSVSYLKINGINLTMEDPERVQFIHSFNNNETLKQLGCTYIKQLKFTDQ